jgi:hypothetical protein
MADWPVARSRAIFTTASRGSTVVYMTSSMSK